MCGLDPSLGPATRGLSRRGFERKKVLDQGVNIKQKTDSISRSSPVRREMIENGRQQDRNKSTTIFEFVERVKMPAIFWLALVMGPSMVCLCWLHRRNFGWNFLAMGMICFLLVNILICLWELCLCYKHGLLRSEVAKRKKRSGDALDVFVLLRNINLLEAIRYIYCSIYIYIHAPSILPRLACTRTVTELSSPSPLPSLQSVLLGAYMG